MSAKRRHKQRKNEYMGIDDLLINSIFPYDPEKNVVVYGGHATWINKMKKLLPGLNYSSVINKDTIKNADIVCIQNNSISHSNYYDIINKAKTANTPIMYFNYAGAKKCALQLYSNLNNMGEI